ncbi:Crotonobetainyl-CoA:carnitine CoA-transferase CaiB [Sphingopyxis sp. YR583]|uniref:CaiB/BaiF CoA transferase family protein n=1 Tax=Sphingopyxis sp. YR583 TaxID=1881047 RepID=UPI0008A777BC|nr:CoA transferase [Sphingopyxis sp. YR583]SEH19226.1 Crotonobetainyl-CoA:carnitine CoA-transferase CaiB [Sphingopyxis sp. YR583]
MIAAGDTMPMLKGVKVVDLTSVVFGPYCTHILADLGAEVVKVETPHGGDAFRWSGKAAATPGMSPAFMTINRGKQSIALDLKKPDDLTAMQTLLRDADVFVLNVRGKAVERLGLDYASVKAINPEIVYAHCVGFAQDGPYADLQAYDDVIQAATGTATLLPRVDGNPQARYLPSLIADKVAGLHAAYAVLAALIHKMRTGSGQLVEIPMFEAFTNFMLLEHLGGLTFDPPNAPVGYFRQIDPDRQPFPTADGFISIVAYTDEAWPRVFEILERPEFLDDERFASRKLRAVNLALLYQEMARLTPSFATAELLRRCQDAQIPAQPVRDLADIMDDPHLAATGFFSRQEHPTEGGYFAMAHPVRFGPALGAQRAMAPRLGDQSDQLKRILGS